MLNTIKTKIIIKLLCAVLMFNLISCGTILYPERKGQTGGRLDPAIVVLDSIGLLLFFIPGVVAFAVDFSNGTIYLPGGKRSQLTEKELHEVTGAETKTEQLEELGDLVRRKSTTPLIFENQALQTVPVREEQKVQALIHNHMRHLALLAY